MKRQRYVKGQLESTGPGITTCTNSQSANSDKTQVTAFHLDNKEPRVHSK